MRRFISCMAAAIAIALCVPGTPAAHAQDAAPIGIASAASPTAPPLVIAMDPTMLLIENPTSESYLVELFFFFWDDPADRHTIRAKDVRLRANGVTPIRLERFRNIFSEDRADPLPQTIAFSLHDTRDVYAVCLYRKTEDDRYVMQDDQTSFLTEAIQEIPRYRAQDGKPRR